MRRAWQPTPISCLENPMNRGPGGLQSIGDLACMSYLSSNDIAQNFLPEQFGSRSIIRKCVCDVGGSSE